MVTRISTRIRISMGICSRSLQGELLFWRATYISLPPCYFKTIGVANYPNILECTTTNSQSCIQITFSNPNLEAIGFKACARKFLKTPFYLWNSGHIGIRIRFSMCFLRFVQSRINFESPWHGCFLYSSASHHFQKQP